MAEKRGQLVFNGTTRKLKLNLTGFADMGKADGLYHVLDCHDVGVNDQYVTANSDVYGSRCKCPPTKAGSNGYPVGVPMVCATRHADGSVTKNNDDDQAYGCWFNPLGDDGSGDFAAHDRSGIGIHGGGSDLPDPFALHQGWEYTFGCLRLQNVDLEQTLVPFIQWVQNNGGNVYLAVYWP